MLSARRFPGDDKPKPIAFPDPARVGLRGERFALLPMQRYIEITLASCMAAPHSAKDLVDVQELIRSAGLTAESRWSSIHGFVNKFVEPWHLAQTPDPFLKGNPGGSCQGRLFTSSLGGCSVMSYSVFTR